MNILDIKKAYIQLLKGLYKNKIKFYGIEIKEGYTKPSFFVDISPVEMGEGLNSRNNVLNIYTTYFQSEVDEVDIYKKIDEIRRALGNKLTVGDRNLNVSEFGYSLIGKDKNILKINFTVSYFDRLEPLVDPEQEYQTIQKLHLSRG